MIYLDKVGMNNLSFPDFGVEKMEYFPQEKCLKITIEGAWLDKIGKKLGKGVLFFNDWESLSISRYDSNLEKWLKVDLGDTEQLRDICEAKFIESNVFLYGFGKKMGQWTEWKIAKTQMHAEFETE